MNKYLLLTLIVCIASCGIGYSQQSNKVTVFPNPATNVVNVLGLKNSTKATVRITNIYGYVELKVIWEIRNNALNIPVTNLNKGIHLISVRSEEQSLQVKFYKQ